MTNKSIEMPDEYIPDYSLSPEEEAKRFAEYQDKVKTAFEEIEDIEEQ